MTTAATDIQGSCDPAFARVKDAFARNFEQHGEVGASLAVVADGRLVVDLCGGHADAARTRPWTQDTIVNVFSTTKGMVSLAAHRLAEQGRLNYDTTVATYWPEFAQAGKERITVRQLLSHRAGLPAVREMLSADTAYNWEPLRDALASNAPWWEPGTRHGYHAVTFGHLVGEVIRRVSGMSVGTYFRKEIAEPLGLDFHIGFGPELDERCAEMVPAPFAALPPDNPMARLFMDPTSMNFKAFIVTPEPMLKPTYMNTRQWRAAEIPAANGHGNARSLARVYGALAGGGRLDGVHVLSPDTIRRATEEHSYGEDAILLLPTRIGLGWMLDVPEYRISPTGALFGHAGLGGSFGYADPDARLGIGYAMNKMILSPDLIDPRWEPMFTAIYGSL